MSHDSHDRMDDMPEETPDVDPAVTVGATTSSHPAAADDVDINRSGSGGSGGPGDDTDEDGGLTG